MANSIRRISRLAFEPFRIGGTTLDPNLLLMLKLVLLGLLLKGYHNSFPDAFAPFFTFMDSLPSPAFRRGLKLVFLLSAAGLLFNRAVRFNAIVIGCVFLAGLLASKVYYRNAIVFVAVLFLLTGLQQCGKAPRLLWWQLGVMYLGAGINKLFEADWRTGQYFDYFLTHIFESHLYATLAPLFPEKALALSLCWWIIVAELSAGLLFFFRRYHGHAVWLAASVHIGAAFLVIGDYGIYLAAVVASYLCTLKWPANVTANVSWRELSVTVDGRTHFGWSALWRAAAWTPATYFAAVVFLTIPYEPWRVFAVSAFGTLGIGALILTVSAYVFRLIRRWFSRMQSDSGSMNGSTRGSLGQGVPRVLILSTLPPFTRNLVWAAGHAGLRCDVVTDSTHASWRNLAHVDRIIEVPLDRVSSCDGALLDEVFEQLPDGYTAVLVSGDTRCTRFVHAAPVLPKGIVLFPQPDADLFEQLYDKGTFAEVLNRLGLPHPKTEVVRSSADLNRCTPKYPAIVKPVGGEGGQGFDPAFTRSALLQRMEAIGVSAGTPGLVQSHIPGDDIDMSLLTDRGRIVAWTIQQRMDDESMRFLEHPEVYRFCARLVAATNYHGVLHVDLRIDSRDGKLYFIEANPRFWGSLCYSTWAGVNFLELGIRLAMGAEIVEPVRGNVGVYPFLGVTRRALPQLLLGGWPTPSRLSGEQLAYWRFYHCWGNGGLRAWFSQYLTGQKV